MEEEVFFKGGTAPPTGILQPQPLLFTKSLYLHTLLPQRGKKIHIKFKSIILEYI